MADVPRRTFLRWFGLAPLGLAVAPRRPGKWVTVPAGFSGGFQSGLTEFRMRVR